MSKETPDKSNQPDDPSKDKPEDKNGAKTDDKSSEENKPEPEKTFTKAELDAEVAKSLRETAKKAQEAEDRAKLSEDERVKAELESVKRENQMLKAESEMIRALKTAQANSAELLFAAAKDKLDFDTNGKLVNLKEIVDELKASYPDQFGTPKPSETIDGGKGNKDEPKGKAETLGEALKAHYKK